MLVSRRPSAFHLIHLPQDPACTNGSSDPTCFQNNANISNWIET
jgi:alpha-L-fucosidase